MKTLAKGTLTGLIALGIMTGCGQSEEEIKQEKIAQQEQAKKEAEAKAKAEAEKEAEAKKEAEAIAQYKTDISSLMAEATKVNSDIVAYMDWISANPNTAFSVAGATKVSNLADEVKIYTEKVYNIQAPKSLEDGHENLTQHADDLEKFIYYWIKGMQGDASEFEMANTYYTSSTAYLMDYEEAMKEAGVIK